MKTFNRCDLPESINYNNKVFTVDHTKVICLLTSYEKRQYIDTLKFAGKQVILVKVLQRNLRGRTDYHGKPYQPSEWFFIA